jgi:hypothetical protein
MPMVRPGEVETVNVTPAQKADPAFTVRPRYWVDEREVLARIARVPKPRSPKPGWQRTKPHLGQRRRPLTRPWRSMLLALAGLGRGRAVQSRSWPSRCSARSRRRSAPCPTSRRRRAELKARFFAPVAGTRGHRAQRRGRRWSTSPSGPRRIKTLACQTPSWLTWQQLLDSRELDAALRTLLDSWMDARSPRWLMGWRDITGLDRGAYRDSRSRAEGGRRPHDAARFLGRTATALAALLGNWLSMTFDYAARQKVGGTHLTYGFLKQLPVLSPEQYSPADLDFIVPRVLELTYTAHDLKAWAEDLGLPRPTLRMESRPPRPTARRTRRLLRSPLRSGAATSCATSSTRQT